MTRVRRKEKKTKKISRDHVLALGGTEDDLDLLTDVDEHVETGTVDKDPALSTDVSKFLKELVLEPKSKGKPEKLLKGKQKESTFIFQPVSQWYAALPSLGPSVTTITPAQLSSLSAKAAQLHENDIHTFQTSSSANSALSEANFLSKIIQSGTLSDRLSALTLSVQSSPLHNIKALEILKGMAGRGKGMGGREEGLKALRCIVDWWVGGGAPNRKLKYFRDQPLLHPDVTDEYLLVWFFEDWLKKYFFSILQILENLSLDPLLYIRTQTITLIFTLLRDKPEQEQNLLRLLVNKLGDTEKSLCSRASYHLLQLLQAHPSMKAVVVREITALVLKPSAAGLATTTSSSQQSQQKQNKHIRFTDSKELSKKALASDEKRRGNPHARYYAAVTFNQILLTPADRAVAVTLLDVYFEMFKEILGARTDGKEQGAKEEGEEDRTDNVKMDKKGRVLERGKAKKSKGKATSNVKGAAGFTEVEDSNSKLISAILTGVNRALPFANIDAEDSGIHKHIDTLFFISHTSTFNTSLQALILIQHITASLSSSSSKTSKSITDRYYRTLYASLHDTRLASSSKQAMYLNLFFKSVKADVGESKDNDRIKALVRRLVQVLASGGGGATEFVAGGLYLLGELFSGIPGLRSMISRPPPKGVSNDEKYDPKKRDPQYVHAASSPLWELTPLLHHYHPAIALHARQLLSSQPLTASPDLSQNTLSHFLDRFVYKNPKKLKPKDDGSSGLLLGKGASAMQPAASGVEGIKLIKGEVGYVGEQLVNEKAFMMKKRTEVPVDQIFFHDYFTRKYEKEKALGKKDKDVEGDKEGGTKEDGDEDVDSEVEEAEIWKVMKATMDKVDDDDDLVDEDEDEDEEIIFGNDSDGEKEGDGGLSLAEDSDDEDLIPLDEVEPEGLIEYDGSDASELERGSVLQEEEEWGGVSNANKRKRMEDTKAGNRKKRKSLPTFASYEEYAKMIEEG